MLCDVCKENQATIRLITDVNGQRTERHLCPSCVSKQKLLFRTEGISNILSAFLQSNTGKRMQKAADLRCAGCGMRFADVTRLGKVGCAQCYQAFAGQLKPLLSRMHGNAQHIGRIPNNANITMKTQRRIEQIRREMDMAVVLEDFELAAELRDEIRELELKGQKGGANG